MIEAERRGACIQRQLREVDPRILEIYEIGEQSGCFYVAMEHFEGASVAELLAAERRLDPARAARYAIEALSQLHVLLVCFDIDGRQRAVVHGDIKPSQHSDRRRWLGSPSRFRHREDHHGNAQLDEPESGQPHILLAGSV